MYEITLSAQLQPLPTLVSCVRVLVSLAKAETPIIRFPLEIRNPEILGSCYLLLLTRAVFFCPIRVSTRIYSRMHTHTDI